MNMTTITSCLQTSYLFSMTFSAFCARHRGHFVREKEGRAVGLDPGTVWVVCHVSQALGHRVSVCPEGMSVLFRSGAVPPRPSLYIVFYVLHDILYTQCSMIDTRHVWYDSVWCMTCPWAKKEQAYVRILSVNHLKIRGYKNDSM